MRYGNTADHLKRGMMAGLILGAVAYVLIVLMFLLYENGPLQRLLPLTFVIVLPALAIGLAIAPTLMFSIHLLGDRVEHRFLDRWTLSQARVSDFARMISPAGIFAAKLQFSDGTNIRILGVSLAILAALENELEARKATADRGVARGKQEI